MMLALVYTPSAYAHNRYTYLYLLHLFLYPVCLVILIGRSIINISSLSSTIYAPLSLSISSLRFLISSSSWLQHATRQYHKHRNKNMVDYQPCIIAVLVTSFATSSTVPSTSSEYINSACNKQLCCIYMNTCVPCSGCNLRLMCLLSDPTCIHTV